MSVFLLLPLLAQVGPASALPSATRPYASSLPIEIIEKKEAQEARRTRQAQVELPAPRNQSGCLGAVEANPQKAAELARNALHDALGRERVRAGLCLGVALINLEQWSEARAVFLEARDAAETSDYTSRARLGAMAGNAALAAGEPGQAIAALAPAATAAKMAGDTALIASIALDRARALVALKQPQEAMNSLLEARTVQSDNAQA